MHFKKTEDSDTVSTLEKKCHRFQFAQNLCNFKMFFSEGFVVKRQKKLP